MIYFDNAATTKPLNSALEFASKFNKDSFYNPSALYQNGIENLKAVKDTKSLVLRTLGLSPNDYEVIFTSCGSESDNQAIFCSVKKGLFVTSLGEHSAVYKSFNELKNRGNNVYFCTLNKDGSVNLDDLFNFIKNNPVNFVSIVHVNNETGAINDVSFIADTIKKINPKIIFHADGVQAYGKIPFVFSKNIDFYSISAHKINALKGTGVLIKKKKTNLTPLIFGGGQENGFRSGTENIFGIKTFEYSAKYHYENINEFTIKVKELNCYVRNNLNKDIFEIISSENASPYILSVSAKGLRGEVIMHSLESLGIIVGNGSACSSKSRFSRVIEACGYSNDVLDGVVRISFSQENTMEETVILVEKLNEIAIKLKGIMKVWKTLL